MNQRQMDKIYSNISNGANSVMAWESHAIALLLPPLLIVDKVVPFAQSIFDKS